MCAECLFYPSDRLFIALSADRALIIKTIFFHEYFSINMLSLNHPTHTHTHIRIVRINMCGADMPQECIIHTHTNHIITHGQMTGRKMLHAVRGIKSSNLTINSINTNERLCTSFVHTKDDSHEIKMISNPHEKFQDFIR